MPLDKLPDWALIFCQLLIVFYVTLHVYKIIVFVAACDCSNLLNWCIVTPGYVPIRTPARKLTATPTPLGGTPIGFFMQTEELGGSAAAAARLLDPQPKGSQQLPFMKPEDAQYFDKLLIDVDEDTLSPEELKERKIMKLLLKIKVQFNYLYIIELI